MFPRHKTAGGGASATFSSVLEVQQKGKGLRVQAVAIAAENKADERADRVLRAWAAAEPGEGATVKQEIQALGSAPRFARGEGDGRGLN